MTHKFAMREEGLKLMGGWGGDVILDSGEVFLAQCRARDRLVRLRKVLNMMGLVGGLNDDGSVSVSVDGMVKGYFLFLT